MTVNPEIIGSIAAVITTLCWLPQALRILRTRDARSVSLPTYAFFSLGIALWLVYGLMLGSPPLIGANALTLILALAIVGLKLRYG